MNPAKSYAHLFSPLGGEGGENYRAPGQLTFLRAPHVPLKVAAGPARIRRQRAGGAAWKPERAWNPQ